jgi:ABC-type transporter Mla subunit MlaD
MKSEILQNLVDARSALSDMIINNTPTTDEEKKNFQNLMRRRDTITGEINQIVVNKFNETVGQLPDKVSSLEKFTDQLNDLDKKIDNINNAIQIADQIIGLVTSIVSIAVVF